MHQMWPPRPADLRYAHPRSQGGSELSLDFSSLLGPLFFDWLCQLLLPLMLVNLVYEKQMRCVPDAALCCAIHAGATLGSRCGACWGCVGLCMRSGGCECWGVLWEADAVRAGAALGCVVLDS